MSGLAGRIACREALRERALYRCVASSRFRVPTSHRLLAVSSPTEPEPLSFSIRLGRDYRGGQNPSGMVWERHLIEVTDKHDIGIKGKNEF